MSFASGAIHAARRLARKFRLKELLGYDASARVNRTLEASKPFDSVLHIGAHLAGEREFYLSLGAKRMVWVEADPDLYAQLSARLGAVGDGAEHIAKCALVSAEDGANLQFHRFSNRGLSSSVHKSTEVLAQEWPDVQETGEVLSLPTRTIDSLVDEVGASFFAGRTLLVIDVQGHELEAIKGLDRHKDIFDCIVCEVSKRQLYEGAALFDEVDAQLQQLGFTLASHPRALVPWHGDVVYVSKAAP